MTKQEAINLVQYAIILVHTPKGILPRGIQFFMKIYGLFKGLKFKWNSKIYNHVDRIYYVNGKGLNVVGSVKGGFKMRKFKYADLNNIKLLTSKEPYDAVQLESIEAQIQEYLYAGEAGYEYANFISWPVYIFSGEKIQLSVNSEKRMECYESGARVQNAAGDYFKNPEYTSIWDYLYNSKLKEIPRLEWEQAINLLISG